MSSKHLASGSENPPLVPGLLRLISMEFCPFAQRPRLVLLAKGVPHDIVNVNLKDKPEWLLQLNPEGKVPVLINGDEVIPESTDICDYLEEKYPEPPLTRSDDDQKKEDLELRKVIDKAMPLFYAPLHKGMEAAGGLETVLKNLNDGLEPLENALKERKTVFFNGAAPGLLDFILWPLIERLNILLVSEDETKYGGLSLPALDETKLPLLSKWAAAMVQTEPVKKTRHPTESHATLMKLYKAGGPVDYDSISV